MAHVTVVFQKIDIDPASGTQYGILYTKAFKQPETDPSQNGLLLLPREILSAATREQCGFHFQVGNEYLVSGTRNIRLEISFLF